MKTTLTGLVVAGLWAAVAVFPISAQTKNWGVGIHGAYFDSGTLAENGDAQLGLDNTGGIGGNLEGWFAGGWLGLRADASYTSSPWALNFNSNIDDDVFDDLDFNDEQAELDAFGDLNVWMADLDLMVRILSPKQGRWFAPFVSVGGGFARWDHPQVDFQGDELNIEIPLVDAFIEGDSQAEPAVTGSIGTDIFWNDNVAFRFEAKDYWNPSSPYLRLDEQINPLDDNFDDTSSHHDGSNNMVYSLGLSFMFGGGGVKEPGFIAVAPEPEPPPPPPPAPTTEQVAMCVVDSNGRLQTVSALRKLDDGQIAVLQNGRPVAFSTAYPTINPRYIRGEQWYIASRPLVLSLDEPGMRAADDSDRNLGPKDKVEFVSFGSAQRMSSNDLIFVGTINNTPAYAPASRVAGVRSELDAKMRTTTDLGRILEDDKFADRFVTEVGTFYLAVEPGQNECLFQPMSSTRTVRRTRG